MMPYVSLKSIAGYRRYQVLSCFIGIHKSENANYLDNNLTVKLRVIALARMHV